jgi:hypothetical protein
MKIEVTKDIKDNYPATAAIIEAILYNPISALCAILSGLAVITNNNDVSKIV